MYHVKHFVCDMCYTNKLTILCLKNKGLDLAPDDIIMYYIILNL